MEADSGARSSLWNGCWKRGLAPWQLLPGIYGPFRAQAVTGWPHSAPTPTRSSVFFFQGIFKIVFEVLPLAAHILKVEQKT